MRKISRYFKPFAIMVVAVVALLFVQAFAEISLPNYMSGIVNTGIQQSGIEHAAPDVISQNGMDFMQAFMSESERKLVDENYQVHALRSANYPENYPTLGEDVDLVKTLIRNPDATQEVQADLDKAFGTSAWTMIYVSRETMPEGQDASGELQDLDFTPLYDTLLPQLKNLPQELVQKSHDQAVQIPDSMRDQTGAAFAKAFYNELGVNVGNFQQSFITRTGLIMLLIAGISAAASISVGFFSSRIAAGVARNLRRDLFQKVESFSLTEYNKFSTASLITRSTNDITQIQTFITMAVRLLLFSPIMAVGGIIMALEKSTSMAWVIALAVLVILGLILLVMAVGLPKFKIMQKLIDKLNLVSRESLSGMLVIRAFGTQKHEEKRFHDANTDLSNTQLFVNRLMSVMFPVMMFVMNGVSLLIVWVGAGQIEAATIQVGDMMAYIQYAMIILFSFLMISMVFIMIPRAQVSAERVGEVLEVEPAIHAPQQIKPFDPAKTGLVEFDNVSFKYEGAEENVLCDISFTAEPGKTTAVIGSTGAGKSTLINLIPRFYDVTAGQVRVNGVDVRDVAPHDLRAEIGYVPQKGMLFSGTIDSNIRYGRKDAPEEDVKRAAEIAQAMDFISEKKDGFQSPISESGANVSGGQKQRLSIARAIASQANVYIFDDSFSALDYKTDTALRKALRPYTKKSTVLIVAQRISTILHADQILVLDEGKIVGKGTHEELMQNCPTYIEIAKSQLGGDAI